MSERRFSRWNVLSHVRAPSPAGVIAVIALVVAMAGGAFAAGAINKGPVSVVTTTGGPTVVTGATADPNSDGQDIPLANPTFTQKAGQVVLVAGELSVTGTPQGEQNCDLSVQVAGKLTPSQDDQNPPVGFEMVRLARRGFPGDRVDSEAVPAPASDRVITLHANAILGIQSYDAQTGGTTNDTCTFGDIFTVSLRVSITSMPG